MRIVSETRQTTYHQGYVDQAFANKAAGQGWTGTAPLDASSGEQNRHRLSRAGNRRMNHVLHIVAVTQLRLDTEGRAYYRRKRAEGKKPMEAMRCLKRRISDTNYRQLVADAQRASETGPGGHCGATQESSAVDLPPHIDSNDWNQPVAVVTLTSTDVLLDCLGIVMSGRCGSR